ncbi:hypothetical protein GCM10009118_30570 [Wandonia haliotis]|uniref:Lipoprotein n=1 Tax=Wandonia haliotis TaxID=574963 RepID=A0ABN1MTM0_9FLAO
MKIKFVFAAAAVAMLSLASCKKDYVCTWEADGVSLSQDYPGLDKDAAEATETTCKNAGGTWSTK